MELTFVYIMPGILRQCQGLESPGEFVKMSVLRLASHLVLFQRGQHFAILQNQTPICMPTLSEAFLVIPFLGTLWVFFKGCIALPCLEVFGHVSHLPD